MKLSKLNFFSDVGEIMINQYLSSLRKHRRGMSTDPWSCAACAGILVEPITLNCGHSSCKKCILKVGLNVHLYFFFVSYYNDEHYNLYFIMILAVTPILVSRGTLGGGECLTPPSPNILVWFFLWGQIIFLLGGWRYSFLK